MFNIKVQTNRYPVYKTTAPPTVQQLPWASLCYWNYLESHEIKYQGRHSGQIKQIHISVWMG